MFRALATFAIVGVAVALLVPKRTTRLSDDRFPEGRPTDRLGEENVSVADGVSASGDRKLAEANPDPVEEAGEESFPASDPPSFNPGTA